MGRAAYASANARWSFRPAPWHIPAPLVRRLLPPALQILDQGERSAGCCVLLETHPTSSFSFHLALIITSLSSHHLCLLTPQLSLLPTTASSPHISLLTPLLPPRPSTPPLPFLPPHPISSSSGGRTENDDRAAFVQRHHREVHSIRSRLVRRLLVAVKKARQVLASGCRVAC